MTQASEIFSIIDEQKKQDEEFLKKVCSRNEKEAKIIIAKYDLKNSSKNVPLDHFCDYEGMVKEFKTHLEKRKQFLDFMSEYL